MSYNRDQFFHTLLSELDAPHSDANLAALRAWGECEGSNAEFNPLDTTQHEAGATEYNSFQSGGSTLHVWNYPDESTGVRATVATLNNGNYPHILAALKDGSGNIVSGAAREDMRTWGTNADCIARKIKEAHNAPAPETHPLALTEEMRANVGRVTNHLRNRDQRLTDNDDELVHALAKAARHARDVK